MSSLSFRVKQWMRRLWFLPAAFSLVAVLTVVLAAGAASFAPDKLPFTMPNDAVVSILTILASSLLTVSVFALSTLVSALAGAAQSTTPRAVPLIVSDRKAQTSISIFIGAFLFAIVGIIGLSSGIYTEAGRLVLFVVTVVVIAIVIWALIRWIGQISAMGRVAETVDRVERAAAEAFRRSGGAAPLGGRLRTVDPTGVPVFAGKIGYVQHIDMSRLQQIADEEEVTVHVTARPGTFADPARALAQVEGVSGRDALEKMADCFVIDDARTFDSDPRLGLIVLNEIAIRALSPAVNDPGTAIDVVGTLLRLLMSAGVEATTDAAVEHGRVTFPPLAPDDLLTDAFRPIARDGAGHIELVLRLVAALGVLASNRSWLAKASKATAHDLLERAGRALSAESDKAALAGAMAKAGF